MTLCVAIHVQVVTPTILWQEEQALGAGQSCILSLYKCAGCAEVKQHRVAVICWEVGEKTDPQTHQPLHRNTLSFLPFLSSRMQV